MSVFLSIVFLVPDVEPSIFYMVRKYSLRYTWAQREHRTVLVHMLSFCEL